MLAAVAVIALSVSCEKEEHNVPYLIGDWELIQEEYVNRKDGVIINEGIYDVTGIGRGITLYREGICDFFYYYGNVSTGIWSLSDTTLKMAIHDENYGSYHYMKWTIDELTSSTLVLSASNGGTYQKYEKWTFRKK